jgi:FKBP-type peptidyl-prolyl cis-trans isomerase SlyD
MKIADGCRVELAYDLFDDQGELVESSKQGGETMVYVHGAGEIPPALERRLEGSGSGDHMEVSLAAGEAYGDYNPDGIITVPRSQFPPEAEIVPGDRISVALVEDEDDEAPDEIEMRVSEISPEAIVLDANHPLAGHAVTFRLEVLNVRQATPEELEEATHDHSTCDHDHDHDH